ncbi:hypothetical protein HYDPIDRAFT_188641 [Hydnomerulius pinastri MD-312]|uniref:Unplaced genomic scaffold scaffold_18, whole genome shotgun sequence n=1 Tax=Hydnomerulius pinastri MD-312 TaxID=994086 RepID=A0A0C9WE67_9AGAM|nr:hypothetical protein HYDPIDRAFT_188641 [Hydnomerulius pinastri MD-312]
MAAAFASSNPSSSFNPGVRPPSRAARGGNDAPGSSKNYVLPVPSGFSVRVFKASTLSASSSRQYSMTSQQQPSAVTKGDIDYRPSAHSRQSGPPARDAPRKLIKAPPTPHAHAQDDRERDRDRGYQGGGSQSRRFGFIHSGPVPDTYVYERSIASSKSDPYHDYYPPSSDSTASDIDSIFSVNSSASSNSSADDDCPPRGMLQVARTTQPERRPSYSHHGHTGQRSGGGSATAFPAGYHTCPTCSEMSSSPPPRPASRGDGTAHGSRPLPTPPVGARVRKDSLVLASERSGPPEASRPRPPQLRIGDRPAYPNYEQNSQRSAWSTAETGGYLSSSPPQLSRSASLRSSGSAGSNSYGTLPPPPGLNANWDLPPTAGPASDLGADLTHRLPHRRNSDGDNAQILPPRPQRSNTMPPPRSVRWCENLVCPSPILPSQRRKGWFNRRGDQLWRNDGSYKPPAPGEEYPIDLDDYPEPTEGWQNEEGTRIDLGRRLIPKALPRGVLKRTNYCPENGIIAGYLTDFPASPTSDDE